MINLIRSIDSNYEPNVPYYPKEYNCKLLKNLRDIKQKYFNPIEGVNIDIKSKQQFSNEIKTYVPIKSVLTETNSDEKQLFYKQQWEKLEKEWKEIIEDEFIRSVNVLQNQINDLNTMTIYPYLTVMDAKFYIDSAIEEIHLCAQLREHYSPNLLELYDELGKKVMNKYLIKTYIDDGVLQNKQQLYPNYLEYFKHPELVEEFNSREYLQNLMIKNQHYNINYCDDYDKVWPYYVRYNVGNFLYNLILQKLEIDANIFNSSCHTNNNKKLEPIFSKTENYNKTNSDYEELKVHPTLIKLYQNACLGTLYFNVNILPMISPSLPWVSHEQGGYLLSKIDLIRDYGGILNEKYYNLNPIFDSVNALSICSWMVNKKILDLAIGIFKSKGNIKIGMPGPLSDSLLRPEIQPNMTDDEKMDIFCEQDRIENNKTRIYKFWSECLYELSIANHYRDEIFWFPHNLDFRGRLYPVTTYFNHQINDLARGLLLFANGQKLGPHGFDWLKIHLINLIGFKNRCSIKEKITFANKIMPLIIDSADRPLDGKKWWMKSNDPWQTLACAMEIANVYRCPEPENYVSHFPIHQDGSCNGLQHYAALVRDQQVADLVNLNPDDFPHDVYDYAATMVEEKRQRDALQGNEIAKTLDGFITRKMLKPTIMSFIYTGTKEKAQARNYRLLKGTKEFPKNKSSAASRYLSRNSFLSIQEMLSDIPLVQEWLKNCAQIICKVYGQPVEWTTPLGFPIIQPYYKVEKQETESGTHDSFLKLSSFDSSRKPNAKKQKKSFNPNFIQSLESSHLMLTSLYCHRHGISFASVHDSYWTHARSVEIMNQICREQFITLHNEPILDNLSDYFVSIFKNMKSVDPEANTNRAISVLGKKFNKGTFNLDNVLKSTYFFS